MPRGLWFVGYFGAMVLGYFFHDASTLLQGDILSPQVSCMSFSAFQIQEYNTQQFLCQERSSSYLGFKTWCLMLKDEHLRCPNGPDRPQLLPHDLCHCHHSKQTSQVCWNIDSRIRCLCGWAKRRVQGRAAAASIDTLRSSAPQLAAPNGARAVLGHQQRQHLLPDQGSQGRKSVSPGRLISSAYFGLKNSVLNRLLWSLEPVLKDKPRCTMWRLMSSQ